MEPQSYDIPAGDYSAKPKEVDFSGQLGRLPVPALMKMWYIGENGDISGCASHVNADMDHGSWQKSYWEKFDRDIVVKTSDCSTKRKKG